MRAKRTKEEKALFIEDYSLPEFQAILDACQSMISEINIEETDRCYALALRALTAINLLVSELRGVSN